MPNVFPAARKPESKSIPIFLLSRLPEVTVCSYSTSNDLYEVKSPLVQVTVVPAEILRKFGTKNLPLFGDEAPSTIETEALPDTMLSGSRADVIFCYHYLLYCQSQALREKQKTSSKQMPREH